MNLYLIAIAMPTNNTNDLSRRDFQKSLSKLLEMTLECRPANPMDFASVFFADEQLAEHELAHALHMIAHFEDDQEKFREQAAAIFSLEAEKVEKTSPDMDSLPLTVVMKLIRALYGDNPSILTSILEFFHPGHYLQFSEYEAIVEMTIICTNFATYLKAFISHALDKLSTIETDTSMPVAVSFQFIDKSFSCLHDSSPQLPNLLQENITQRKWDFRVRSIAHTKQYFRSGASRPTEDDMRIEEFINDSVFHYFNFICNDRAELFAGPPR